MKFCNHCKTIKPLSEFYRGTRRGASYVMTPCKRCNYLKTKRWRDLKPKLKTGCPRGDPRDRLLAKSAQSGDCLLYMGSLNNKGYGKMNIGQISYFVHRLSYEVFKGQEIPLGMFVCHSCDRPSCINPQHLWLGTQAQNIADMRNKGRAFDQYAKAFLKLEDK